MKRVLTILMSILMAFTSVSVFALGYGDEWAGYQNANASKYSDVSESHWAYNAIEQASSKNWFGGYPDGTFRPNGSITREEAIKVFVMFLGLDYQSVDLSDLTYSDVKASDWSAPYIEAGKDLFPVHTTIQGKIPFNPKMPVTREDTIYALVKALGCDAEVKYPDQSVLNMFSDSNSISGNIKGIFSIALMREHQLVSGFPDGTIRAQAPLTRAEFATLLLRGLGHGFHDNYQAQIQSVEVMPQSPIELEVGANATLSARATYSDGSNKPYNSLSPYDAENNGVIALNGTTITGLKEGTTTIKFNDSYLKNKSVTVVVKNPTGTLKLKVTDYPETTELNKVAVSGMVEDKNLATVDLTCNGKDIKIEENGSFTVNMSLNVGANELKFVAKNQYGETAEKTITVVRTDNPVIKITKYRERTTEKTTPVSGVVEYHDLSAIKVDCNGEGISLNSDGTFTIDVKLQMGKNPFLFTATTNSGNKAEQAIVIRRYELLEPDPETPVEPDPIILPEEIVYEWDWMQVIPVNTEYKRVEAVLVIDDSGSLGGDYGYDSSTGYFRGGQDPEHKRLEVARKFIENSNEKSKIGIVKFDYNSQILTPNLVACDSAGKETLKNMLQINNGTFDSRGTTYMYTGINDGFNLFESNDPEVMKVMIVFSDGMAHDTHLHAQTVLDANAKDVTIYSVGLGAGNSDYFDEYMKPLATNTNGAFYLAENADNLKDIFETITIMIDTVTDSDGDEIEDYYEDTIKYQDGSRMALDKNNSDTDGDGRSDGEEIRLEKEYNADMTEVKVTAYMSSDPTKTDSDGDGISDKDDNYPLDPKG